MKTVILTILLSMINWVAFSQDCLPNYLTKSKYHILTVRSDTYSGAKQLATEQIPNIGVMTKINATQAKVMTSNLFSIQSSLRKKVDIEIPMYRQFECRDERNGDWLISIIMPKEGITYLDPKKYPSNLTIPYMQKLCKGYDKFGYVIAGSKFRLQAEKIIALGYPYGIDYIVCGEMDFKSYAQNRQFNNIRNNFIAVYGGQDITEDLWLNLINDIKGEGVDTNPIKVLKETLIKKD